MVSCSAGAILTETCTCGRAMLARCGGSRLTTAGYTAIAACDLGGALRLVTGGRDGAVRVWNPATAPAAGPPAGIRCLMVMPPASNGQTLIASVGPDGTNAWLDAADGQILARSSSPGGRI